MFPHYDRERPVRIPGIRIPKHAEPYFRTCGFPCTLWYPPSAGDGWRVLSRVAPLGVCHPHQTKREVRGRAARD